MALSFYSRIVDISRCCIAERIGISLTRQVPRNTQSICYICITANMVCLLGKEWRNGLHTKTHRE